MLSIYIVTYEVNKTISKLWDGRTPKLTFRRSFSPKMMNLWFDLEAIVESISFHEECDTVCWEYESRGSYSVQSCYAIVSYRGIIYPCVHFLCGRSVYLLGCAFFFGS